MQGIWSRASQSQGCHGRACAKATSAIMMRRPTSASRHQHRPRSSNVFTACYSVRVDVSRSEPGRQELPSAGTVLGVAPIDFAATFSARPQTRLEAFWSICSWTPEHLVRQQQILEDKEEEMIDVKRLFLVANEYPRFTEIERFAELQDLGTKLISEDTDPEILHREPKTEYQAWNATHRIQDLTEALLYAAYNGDEVAMRSLDSGWQVIRMLQNEGFPRFKHPEIDPDACVRARHELNEANRRLMERWSRRFRISLLTKICHNLLVCEFLPGIQNYNTLIIGFTQLGEHDLAQAVVDMYLFRTHLLPTRATFLALLHHFRLRADTIGFHAVLRRLVAHDSRGIGIRRKLVEELEVPFIHNWASNADISVTNGWLVERATLDPSILEALLKGFLDLKEPNPAAKMFAVCLQEGAAVSTEVFSKLLSACLAYIDHDAARILMQAILGHVDQIIAIILEDTQNPVGLVRKLRQLVVLCASQVTSTGAAASASPDEKRLAGALERLIASLWAKNIWSQLFLWRDCTSRLKTALGSRRPLVSKCETAIAALNRLSRLQVSREAAVNNYASLTRVSFMAEQVVKSSRVCQKLEFQVHNRLAAGLPRRLRGATVFDTALDYDQRMEWFKRYSGSWSRKSPVAACYRMSRELDDRLRWIILDALPIDMAERIWDETGSECVQDLGPKYLQNALARYLEELQRGEAGEQTSSTTNETQVESDPFAKLQETAFQPQASTGLTTFEWG